MLGAEAVRERDPIKAANCAEEKKDICGRAVVLDCIRLRGARAARAPPKCVFHQKVLRLS